MVATMSVPAPGESSPPTKVSRSTSARVCAPEPVSIAAAKVARALYYDLLNDVRPPAKHKIVPDVTVTLSYHVEPVE